MSLSVLLLLLMVCSTQASDFFNVPQYTFFDGTYTYYTKDLKVNGTELLSWRYIYNSHYCSGSSSSGCLNSSCGYLFHEWNNVDMESSGEWCQSEYFSVQPRDNVVSIWLDGNWINGLKNNIRSWKSLILVEQGNRSDTGKTNSSPQTTMIPVVRVPSNCQRDFSLLMFDPDGDDVKCRYGNTSSECDPCNPPSVLSLSPSCTLSFSPTNSSNEGPYAVQVLMEDFPRETITLTDRAGTQTIKTTNDVISTIMLQFVLLVDPAVPSCTGGDFLPQFVPPTPDHRAQLYTNVRQTLEISIRAEAKNSTISELLFSGPYNVIKNQTGPGEFTLTWTPLEPQAGQIHPICFVIQALSNGTKYHSELRCLTVGVGGKLSTPTETTPTTSLPTTTPGTTTPAANTPAYVAGLSIKLSSLVDLSLIDTDTLQNQIKEVLVKNGLPSDITVKLTNSKPPIGAITTTSVYGA